ncbi:MAG: amidase, partial [Gammaproteobacteria bacterium]|nr:amidase [Gammaproteobacteria bacterium]
MTNNSDLCSSALLDVAALIERRDVSPVDVVQAMLDRIERLDGRLNTYVTVCAEQAIADARAAEADIIAGGYRGPLHGVTFAVKDIVQTRGILTTCGSRLFPDWRPEADATVVERLRAAGAILIGKLRTTEFALYGYPVGATVPVNPWNPDYWAGVSSSGSGAAMGASLCHLAIGTDTAGSIRFPSAANGVVGIKASYGKVSRHGVFPLAETLDHVGPMTHSVADGAAPLRALAGRDRH